MDGPTPVELSMMLAMCLGDLPLVVVQSWDGDIGRLTKHQGSALYALLADIWKIRHGDPDSLILPASYRGPLVAAFLNTIISAPGNPLPSVDGISYLVNPITGSSILLVYSTHLRPGVMLACRGGCPFGCLIAEGTDSDPLTH